MGYRGLWIIRGRFGWDFRFGRSPNLWVIRGRFGWDFRFGRSPNLWVIRGYGLSEVWVKRGSTVLRIKACWDRPKIQLRREGRWITKNQLKHPIDFQLSRYSRTESSPIPEATYTSGGTKSDTMRILGLIFSRYTRQSRVPGAVDARCGPIRSCATSFVKGSRYYIRTPPSSSVYGEHDADAIAVSFHSVGHSEIFDLSDFQHSEIWNQVANESTKYVVPSFSFRKTEMNMVVTIDLLEDMLWTYFPLCGSQSS
jgi:hypothetical protein